MFGYFYLQIEENGSGDVGVVAELGEIYLFVVVYGFSLRAVLLDSSLLIDSMLLAKSYPELVSDCLIM